MGRQVISKWRYLWWEAGCRALRRLMKVRPLYLLVRDSELLLVPSGTPTTEVIGGDRPRKKSPKVLVDGEPYRPVFHPGSQRSLRCAKCMSTAHVLQRWNWFFNDENVLSDFVYTGAFSRHLARNRRLTH